MQKDKFGIVFRDANVHNVISFRDLDAKNLTVLDVEIFQTAIGILVKMPVCVILDLVLLDINAYVKEYLLKTIVIDVHIGLILNGLITNVIVKMAIISLENNAYQVWIEDMIQKLTVQLDHFSIISKKNVYLVMMAV